MQDFKAAIKQGNSWKLTDNAEQILESEEVIYVTDIESLEFELQQRHPAPEGFKLLGSTEPYYGRPCESIRVHDTPIAKVDTEPEVIFEYAREHGSVDLGSNKKIEFEPSTARSHIHIANDEFYASGRGGTLIYDPKTVRGTRSRRRGTKKGRINNGVPSIQEASLLRNTLCRSLSKHPAMGRSGLTLTQGSSEPTPKSTLRIMHSAKGLSRISKFLWRKRQYREHTDWESTLEMMKPYIPEMKLKEEKTWVRIARWLEVEVRILERKQEAARKLAA